MLRNLSRINLPCQTLQAAPKRLLSSTGPQDAESKKDLVVSFDESTGIQTLRLNRPKRLNAINFNLYAAIPSALTDTCDDPKVKLTVLTGTGRYFSSGNDLADMAKRW